MTLHLVVPGLFGPAASGAVGRSRIAPDSNAPRFPFLERIVARSLQRPGADNLQTTLFDAFGVPETESPPATAALCYLADTGRLPDTWLAHADPVHLRADQDRLLLFAGNHLAVNETQAQGFIECLNGHFADDGLSFEAPTPGRWYLRLEQPPEVVFSALDEVVGRNIDSYLPKGPQQRVWRGYMNEIQMLFHDLAANHVRDEGGQLAISGVWLSGGGVAPAREAPRLEAAGGDGALLQGLCRHSGLTYLGEDLTQTISRHGDCLHLNLAAQQAVINADPTAWETAIASLEASLRALAAGQQIHLYPCDGRVFEYQSGARFKVWRRARPLTCYRRTGSVQSS